jgi:hypothetical protein
MYSNNNNNQKLCSEMATTDGLLSIFVAMLAEYLNETTQSDVDNLIIILLGLVV